MKNSFEHHYHTFDSGLRLMTIPMPATRTATVLVLVGTGSKYETKQINGISHFLEHMMFKGTTKRPDKMDIARELDGIGAEYNAFTSKEYTGYYAKASAKKVDTTTDVVFDIFLNSKLKEEDIAVEKGVIVEEINMYRDLPQRYVGELFERLLYGDQPAGWDTAGEKEIVTALKRDDFVNYFNSHYIASNTIVAVAGNVDPDYIKNRTGELFKNIRHSEPFDKLKVVENQVSPQALVHYKKTDQTHFHLGFRSIDMFNEKRYAVSLLGHVLGGGMSSRLFDEIREKRGLAYYVGAGNQAYTDSGYFLIRAGVNNEKAKEAMEVSLQEVAKVKESGITAEELQRAKDSMEGSLALGLEHSDAVAEAYAEPILFKNEVLTPEAELDKIKKVTLEEVHGTAKEIFNENKLNLAVIGPFEDKDQFDKILKL
ncbi:MAG: insulinase family protein [Candidatus Yanofskybacteria bacterium]|nr:insulinase family protein [Candidatus Yanofskybacteria bacterium]